MKNKAKVTISKRGMHAGDGVIAISISDTASCIDIVEVEMELSDFAECLTGLGHVPAVVTHVVDKSVIENVGKKRETKTIFVHRPNSYSREEQRKKLYKSIAKSGELRDGWMIHSDGLRVKQPRSRHAVILYRFVENQGAK